MYPYVTGIIAHSEDYEETYNKVNSIEEDVNLEPYSYLEFERYINAVITPLCRSKNKFFDNNESF